MYHTSVHWVSALPAVLLGLRTVYKEDLQCFPAEMDYGESLCLPSQFFVQQEPQAADNGFIKKLKPIFSSCEQLQHLIILQNLLLCIEISVCVPMSFCVWTLFNLPCRNLIHDFVKFCHERIKFYHPQG
ncbi:hypothetical protein AVEN_123055-1 [Araneus ventricosus]|uniref:Secreted protein n=1 Tax=Araneus ventricosus TaxID=182803 RepID=A0A4Y2MG04_ARAVE|nr:hypothetical protein AVEN_123055-1 [Araneus ventricosus]